MIRHIYRGIYFVFEGVDGNGKSTIAQLFKEWLVAAHKMNVEITKEPDRSRPYGKMIYEDLNDPNGLHINDPMGFQRMFACDSKQNVRENIKRILSTDRGAAIGDRCRHSRIYGAKDKSEFETLRRLNAEILGEDFLSPDLAFILDVSTETSMNRLRQKGRNLDGLETESTLVRVRQNYIDFQKIYSSDCHLISGEQKPEEILEEIKVIAVPLLRRKGFITD